MPQIAITNSKGRDAAIAAESVRHTMRVRWVDAEDRQAASAKILKGTIERDFESMQIKFGDPEAVAQAMIHNDPEIDLESVGRFLRDTSRVYVNSDKQIVYGVTQEEIIRAPDGTEKSRRPKKSSPPNVGADLPALRWSGKMLPKKEAFNKFVMVNKLQLKHVNGLTYDFLFEIAEELEKKDSLLLLGAGPKANLPLILRHRAMAYRGFLEGRTRGKEYCLLLHLSNIELKAPEAATEVVS